MILCVLTGLLAGLLHVFSGPDHLAAVAPLSAHQRGKGWRTGFQWGFGHASGVILVGVLSLALRELLPLDFLSSTAERSVGVILIAVGLWGLRKAFTNRVHVHEHSHGGDRHAHIHVHGAAAAHSHAEVRAHRHTHAAFAIGTVHGLAGSSHFFAVLPSLAMPTTTQAVAYLLAYGCGTVLAMGIFSQLMALLSARFATRPGNGYRVLMSCCSGAAVVVGGYWLVS